MTVIPETTKEDNNEEKQQQNQQGRVEENQAGVTGQVPKGVEQAQNQANAGATGGQMESQNNGTAEGLQEQALNVVDNERQAQGVQAHEERRAPNRSLLQRFLQEVKEAKLHQA